MATIQTAKRVLAVSKGLVTLSSAITKRNMSNTSCGIAFASTAVAATLVYRYIQPWVQAENATLRQVLEGGGANPEEASDLISDVKPKEVEEVVYIGDVPMIMTTPPTESDKPVKRRIRKGCRGKFVREIVAAVKLRIGTPKPTMANRRAVQRIAREELKEYELRKVVAASVIPMIVEAVFVPSKWEVAAAKLGSCPLAQSRKYTRSLLLELAGFNEA